MAAECILPAMHPAEVWRRSGRWEVMGEELFRVRDRKGAELALGVTHEEIFTTLALELRSYRDLPQVWYHAANVEKATSALPAATDGPGQPAPEPFPTPGVRTIEELAAAHQASADRQVKTLVYVVDGRPTLVLLRGDHSLVKQKLFDATGAAEARPARPGEIRDALGASAGSLGAVGVHHLPVVADEALRGRRDLFTGANLDDAHLKGVDVDRDIRVGRWADLREVAAGEPCPVCGRPVEVAPFVVAVVVLDPGDPDVVKAAEAVQGWLEAAGTDVLVDDRDERPGVKFRDAELIGFPFRVTIGARDLAAGRVELVRRDTGERRAVAVDAVAGRVLELTAT